MKHSARADEVSLFADEDGWRLAVFTEDGDEFLFNVHDCAWELAEEARGLVEWRREGEAARVPQPHPDQMFVDDLEPDHDLARDVRRGK